MRSDRDGAVPSPLIIAEGWPTDSPGGLNSYVAAIADSLIASGSKPRVLVTATSRDLPAHVTAIPPGGVARRLWRFAVGARRSVRDADVVDAHFALYALGALLVRRVRRRPLVVHFHGPWARESASAGSNALAVRVKRLVEVLVYRRAARLIVLTDHFADVLRTYGIEQSRIVKILPGVDPVRFRVLTSAERESYRAELGIAPSAKLAVAVRRLVPRMGLEMLISAWADVQRVDPSARLVVIGDGPDRANLQDQVDALGLGPSISLVGRVDAAALSQWYGIADLAVTPSTELEGFGLVLLEAMMCGTPVLASDLPGIREALGDLGPDHLVSPVSTAAWSDALLAFFADAHRAEARAEARDFAERHSWAATAEATLDVFRSVLDERRSLAPRKGR